MDSAKILYGGYKNNFKVIHIDPSIPPKKYDNFNQRYIGRAFELMEFCYEYSQK